MRRHRPDTTSCVRPESALEHVRSASACVARLAEHARRRTRPPCRRRARAARPPVRPNAPSPARARPDRRRLLVVVGRDDVERDAAAARGSRAAAATSTRGSAAAQAGAPNLLARPLLRPLGVRVRSTSWSTASSARVELDELARSRSRSRAAGDPVAVAELELDLVPASVHSILCRPRCGRCSVSTGPPSAVAQSTASVELRRKTSWPPGRSSRAASGIHFVRVAPDRRAVLGERRGRTTRPAARLLGVRLDELSPSPNSASMPPRGLELRRRHVDADDARAARRQPRAEVRGAAAELDDVLAVDVGQHADLRLRGRAPMPQAISSSDHASCARASVYSAFAFVHASRLTAR